MTSKSITEENTKDDNDLYIQKSLNNMTINDLDQFLNVYRLITSSDPNADKLINQVCTNKVCMNRLLSGEFSNDEDFNELLIEKVEDESEPVDEILMNDSTNDRTFFDVYDHIEDWKKRIQPAMNKIDDLVQECKIIVQQTSIENKLNDVEEPNSNVPFEQIIKNNDITLSNIDKYIESGESVHPDLYNLQLTNKNEDTKEKPFQIKVENRKTLLIPSNSYLESGYTTNIDDLEVKTYFIE